MMKNLLKAAASLSVAGFIVAGAAMPALAATGTNEAYAAAASGLISISPLADATFPGTSPANLANINVPGLLTAGVVNDTAGPTSASSTIANAAVTLTALARLRADAVTSSCNFDTTTGTVSGTASITNGRVRVGGVTTLTLAANPAPNTTVTVPGIATVVLNQQSTDGSGTLTVNAISLSLLGSTQTLTLGTSICNKATLAPVAALPGMAMPIGLGVAGLLGVAGVAYYFSKRRRFAAAA